MHFHNVHPLKSTLMFEGASGKFGIVHGNIDSVQRRRGYGTQLFRKQATFARQALYRGLHLKRK